MNELSCASVIVAVMVGLTSTSGHAETTDSCDSVLTHGIYDSYSAASSAFSYAEFHNAMCNGTISQKSTTDSSGGGGSVSIGIPGIVDIGLGGNLQQAKTFQEYYKQTFCGASSAMRIDDSRLANFKSVVSPTIVEAYIACVTARDRGLQVDVQRPDDDVITFGLTFSQPGSTAQFNALYVNPKSAATCVSPTLTSGTRIDGNTRSITCSRTPGSLSEFALAIHTTVGTFSYLMPALPAPTKSTTFPIGTVIAFAGASEPAGWKFCNGQFISTKDYPELYRLIGVTLGASEDRTRFALPDLRGRFVRGLNVHATGGTRDPDSDRALGSVEDWATGLPKTPWATSPAGSHNHGDVSLVNGGHDTVHEQTDDTPGELDIRHPHQMPNAGEHTHVISGGDAETRPVNVGLNYIIYVGIPNGPR